MGDKTGIQWTEATWNPLRGCSLVSAGCKNCYAMGVAGRFSGPELPYEGLAVKTSQGYKWTGKIMLVPEMLGQPLRWRRPRRIFVNSMSDLFHESVPEDYIDKVFAVMAMAKHHTFQILTKRPTRMRDYMIKLSAEQERIERAAVEISGSPCAGGYIQDLPWPLKNVQLGVSAEDQDNANLRIPILLETPAAIRWVSAEPLLGPIDFGEWLFPFKPCNDCPCPEPDKSRAGYDDCCKDPEMLAPKLDWIVVGGESGPDARPMLPKWAQDIAHACAASGTPFLFKQFGEYGTKYRTISNDRPVFRQFDTYQQWVNKASTWVNGGICLDTNGKELKRGKDFMEARDAGTFPVTIMHKMGKKAAGRLLDGFEHNGYPKEPT